MFREEGCNHNEYKTAFLGQIRRGVENVLPDQGDKRRAFLLPLHIHKWVRKDKASSYSSKMIVRFAVILGFVGMLRPHTLRQVTLTAIIPVVNGSYAATEEPPRQIDKFMLNHDTSELLGFYIEFKSKTQHNARAYFPNLSSPSSHYSGMCPVKAMKTFSVAGVFE